MNIPKTVWLFLIAVIGLPLLAWHTIDRMSELEPQTYMAYMNKRRSNRACVVIGDEMARDAHDKGFDRLLKRATGTDVVSAGLSGETTKMLYRDLACERFEWVIEGRPTYAVLMIGMNDHKEQLGPGQYAYHIRQIVDLLTYYDIRTVVVGIPHYDAEAYYAQKNIAQRIYYRYFALVGTGSTDLDNMDMYREELDPGTLPQMASYVDNEELGLNDSICWTSATELSEAGYARLATAVAAHVKKHRRK